tara:strand:+ start:1555 stop:1935 length:381 start_codon:yes stop_codon:yes gene_type:complete
MNLRIDNHWTTTLSEFIADNEEEGCIPLTEAEKADLQSLSVGDEIIIETMHIERIADNTSYYVVIQKGYAVFGAGVTRQEAWIAAQEWMDADGNYPTDVSSLPSYNTANVGDFCCVTKDEYDLGNC